MRVAQYEPLDIAVARALLMNRHCCTRAHPRREHARKPNMQALADYPGNYRRHVEDLHPAHLQAKADRHIEAVIDVAREPRQRLSEQSSADAKPMIGPDHGQIQGDRYASNRVT